MTVKLLIATIIILALASAGWLLVKAGQERTYWLNRPDSERRRVGR